MVPPRSNRVSRAPPYSRTRKLPYPYRAVTVCGAPFQTLPVRVSWPLAWSAFARRYLRSRCCCPFLRLLRCFSSPGSPHAAMDSPHDTAKSGGLPHSEIRGSTGARPSPRLFAACHVLHRLSVPRHSPDALIVPRPRPTPSTQVQKVRDQMTDIPARLLAQPGPRANTAPPTLAHRQAHTHAQARPQPSATMPGMMAGPASRSRLASRFHKIKGQRTDGRPDKPPPAPPSQIRGSRRQTTRQRPSVLCPSVLRHRHLVGLGRFERPTSRLSGVRSNQLSYRPKTRDQRTDDRGQTRRSGALAPTLEPVGSLISVLCPLIWKGCVDGGPDRLFQTTDDRPQMTDKDVCPLISDLCPLTLERR